MAAKRKITIMLIITIMVTIIINNMHQHHQHEDLALSSAAIMLHIPWSIIDASGFSLSIEQPHVDPRVVE